MKIRPRLPPILKPATIRDALLPRKEMALASRVSPASAAIAAPEVVAREIEKSTQSSIPGTPS